MKKFLQNLTFLLIAAVLVLQPYFALESIKAAGLPANDLTDVDNPPANPDRGGNGKIIPTDADPIVLAADDMMGYALDNSATLSKFSDNNFISKVSNLTSTSKLVFKTSDLQDLRILNCLGNVIPDYANHDDALAAATGKTLQEIADLKAKNPADYQKLITQAEETARTKIASNLKNDLPNFACIAGINTDQAADMLRYNQETANAIIDYAQNKIVIDRRILELLVNLVTTKDQGGAGHERIKIFRLRSGYDRDARQNSRESDAIRQQIAQAEQQASISTIGDVSSASRDDLSTTAGSDPQAQAAVIDSAGNSQGDLIFSDKESDANISAHYKGEAVDISEVDNIKCTLIKKKRIGGDSKTAMPPTPIKIAWQTSAGYDSSPPADYSSVQMNLQQIASGQYMQMLDELGIDPDSEENLSDASFGDIVGLIGESLLAEIISSPSNSLSGYSLADTAKKIGGMVLADKLGLPRAAFIDGNLSNLSDLETKIGEANLEKKLSLQYGSIRGANLAEILQNIGLRDVEKQLGAPSGSIKPGMSSADIQLSIGRSVLDNKLKLQPGTFQSATTYSKLEEAAGQRKIDLLFSDPAQIDETLGIDFGLSASYKSGGKNPDAYATIVGAKLLANHAYIYSYASSAGNAMRLSVDPTVGTTPTDNTAALDNSTNIARARFNWIMSGNLNPVSGVASPASFDELYKSIGIETLSSALDSNSVTRTALTAWLGSNSNPSSTNCTVPLQIKVKIPKPGSTTGELIDAVVPEDQIMASFGLRQGDLARLFGCYNVSPASTFKDLGERALYDSVRNSTLAQQTEARFLAEHPEVSNILSDINFYKTRVDAIKTKTDKIKNDWAKTSSTNQQAQVAINQINGAITSVSASVSGINTNDLNLLNIATTISQIRLIPVLLDQIMAAVQAAQNSGDQSLSNQINSTLADISTVIQATDEIISGRVQPQLSSLQINDITTNGSGGGSSGSNSSNSSINRATLVLMLSGRLSPIDFLTSVGTGLIEDSLNIPANGIFYYAKYLQNPKRDINDGKGAFFRAIGQAQLEETFGMPPFFFQGDTPGAKATLTDVKKHVATSFGISEAEAGARIMQALNIPGEFSTIEQNDISNISTAVLAANNIDGKLSISQGTTANFLSGKPLGKSQVGNSEIRMLAGKFNVSEQVIDKYLRVKDGKENITDAKKDNFGSEITYVSHNEFAAKPAANPGSNLADQCPINFTYNTTTKTFSSNYQQDNSYVLTDATGTHSSPSLADARNYQAISASQNQQIDFVKALSVGIVSANNGSVSPNADSVNKINTELTNFVNNPKAATAFNNSEMVVMQDQYDIPINVLQDTFSRKDIVDAAANVGSKPINSYLEIIGAATAEHRITSALLGSLATTFGSLAIDATDIFDILDGNGMQVAYRIGARYMEEHLGVTASAITSILEAPTQLLRQCSLSAIGGSLLGGALGLGAVSLSGNIYSNIGSAKIEQVLGISAMSFRGANIDELITNIGPSKFAEVFHLPPSIVLPTTVTSNIVGSQAATYAAQMPDEEQLGAINNMYETPSYSSVATAETLTTSLNSVKDNIKNFLAADSSYSPIANPNSSQQNYQTANFQSRLTEIDGMLGIDLGSTQKLLHGQQTPDQYRKLAASKVLAVNVGNILEILGLGEYKDMMVKMATRAVSLSNLLQETLNGLNSCGNNPSSLACKNAQINIFNNMEALLGVNFDAKLGLKSGTLETIIRDPQQAVYQMASSALTRLDASLGLVDENGVPAVNASFTSAFTVLYGTNYLGCDTNPSGCLSSIQNEPNVTLRAGIGLGVLPSAKNFWSGISYNIGTQLAGIGSLLAGNWLTKIGILPEIPKNTSAYAGFPDSQTLIRQSVDMLTRGDLRILAISAAIKAAEALHIYDNSTTPNLPEYYRITFEDIYYGVMGDPLIEAGYVNTASNNFLNNWQATNVNGVSTPTEESEMTSNTGGFLYGSQCPPDVDSMDCYTSANPGASHYNTYDNLSATEADFATQYPVPENFDPLTPTTAITQQNDASIAAMNQYVQVQASARNQARQATRNILLWRMADAKLYQIDKNIPPGFARTMFQGNGVERTQMLGIYLENFLNNLEIGGVSVGDVQSVLSIIGDVKTFMSDPKSFNLDALVKSGKMATLDSWLNSKFSNFFGFNLAPGTFTAILYGFKTGNFKNDITVTGPDGKPLTIQSITHIYTDWAVSKVTSWADNLLGLPQGTVYTAYTMYRNLAAARTAIAAASLGVGSAQAAFNAASSVGDAAALAKAQQNLDAANKALADANEKATQLKATLISFIITTVFSKQIAQLENALGLVPGTGAILVGLAVSYIMSGESASAWLSANWLGIALFVLINLFGVYTVKLVCTADGYYPGMEDPAKVADPTKVDNGGLGEFDGLDNNGRKEKYVTAAQYKARTLAGDALMLAERTGDTTAVPMQIMVGRQEDVDYWKYKTDQVVCSRFGGCSGTQAGMWLNPQTTAYTHIGF
ncbi:MAG: hypothetical protein NTY30_00660 [Candidatus Berkelbacteria bacterium]|nr:hypothetical protein [Candidatus Berkelbacteria bacterium]